MYTALGIENATSTAYHPQTDGQTERVNQELEQYLRCYTSQVQDDWAKYVSLAEFAYNNRKHSATTKSPFEIILGYHPAIEPMGITDKVDLNEHVKNIWQKQKEAYHALLRSQEQMTRYANKHRGKEPTFKVGDKVLISMQHYALDTKSRKLSDRYMGPYEIIKQHGKVNYELKLPDTMKIHPVFYAGNLKEYKEKEYPGRPKYNKPIPEIIDGEEEYEVEEIQNCRKTRGKYYYLIKWKEYDRSENTWEEFGTNLAHAVTAINEFHEKHPLAIKPDNYTEQLEKLRRHAKGKGKMTRAIIARDYAYNETDDKPKSREGPRSRSTSTPHSAIRLKLYNEAREKGEPFTLREILHMMNDPEYRTQETIEEGENTSEEPPKKKTRRLTRLGSIKGSDMEVDSIDL